MTWADPRRRRLVGAAICIAVAILLRWTFVAVATKIEGCTSGEFVRAADGREVLSMAAGWAGDLDRVRREPFYERLSEQGGLATSHLIRFFPVTGGGIALAKAAGLRESWAAMLPFWLFMAATSVLIFAWQGDLRVGVMVAVASPIVLYSTSFSDPLGWVLAFEVAGLILLGRERFLLAGAAMGLACWARPEPALLLLACGAALVARRAWREVSRIAAGAAAACGLGVGIVVARFGTLLDQLSATGSNRTAEVGFFDWPARSLAAGLFASEAPAWKRIYVGAHVLFVALALAFLIRDRSTATNRIPRIVAQVLPIWLGLQAFWMISLRGGQGFDDFPRYSMLALPALAIAWRRWIPRSPLVIAIACSAVFVVALIPARKNIRPECGSTPVVGELTSFRPADRVVAGSVPAHRPPAPG